MTPRRLVGLYVTDNSDLVIDVIKSSYWNNRYIKIKINLYNKHNGILYESRTNYKVYWENISHWRRK